MMLKMSLCVKVLKQFENMEVKSEDSCKCDEHLHCLHVGIELDC